MPKERKEKKEKNEARRGGDDDGENGSARGQVTAPRTPASPVSSSESPTHHRKPNPKSPSGSPAREAPRDPEIRLEEARQKVRERTRSEATGKGRTKGKSTASSATRVAWTSINGGPSAAWPWLSTRKASPGRMHATTRR